MKLDIISIDYPNKGNQRVHIKLREDSFIGNYGLLINDNFVWFPDSYLREKETIDVYYGSKMLTVQENGIVLFASYLGNRFVLFELKDWQYIQKN